MTDVNKIAHKDLYKILGCARTSTAEQLKQAYHRKLLQTHPDKNDNVQTQNQRFQEVKLAWQILGDTLARKQYDRSYKQGLLDLEAAATVYAFITRADLEPSSDREVLTYPCRCGNSYLVDSCDLQESNCVVHVPCQDCTFVIAVET